MEDEPKFIKQVPLHPSDRLRKNNKQIQHPRNRLTQIKVQIKRNNVSKLMRGELDFSMKNILSKTLLFDTSKMNKEIIIGKIAESLKSVLFLEEIINNRLLKKFKNPSIKETPSF